MTRFLKLICLALCVTNCATKPPAEHGERLVPVYYQTESEAARQRNAGNLRFLSITLGVIATAATAAILKK